MKKARDRQYWRDVAMVANVLMTRHTDSDLKLKGLFKIVDAGFDVKTSDDFLYVGGALVGWNYLEAVY